MKKTNIWNRMSAWLLAFLILAFAFLVLGLGTLGSVLSTGDAYALSAKRDTDGKEPCIMLQISEPDDATYLDANGEEQPRDLYIKEIYCNIGAIYGEYGEVTTLRLGRSTTAGGTFYNYADIKFANRYEEVAEDGKSSNPITASLYNWAKYTVTSTDGWRIRTYPFYKITIPDSGSSMLINEIVFVANDRDLTAEGEHKPVVLRPTVYSDGTNGTLLPYDAEKGETLQTAIDRASAIVDSPRLPNLAESSFFRFGEEEIDSLLTVSEIRQANSYIQNAVYHIDTDYGALGNGLLTLGTYIGGMSPFGLRLMPFLASFGVLVLGFLFVRKLTGSDKAGFVFAVLYALCGVSISLGHLGTPLMFGVFFFTAALYFVTVFFRDGMKKADFLSAVPPMLAGLFSAAAVCVNSAFLIPVLGIVGLFVLGLVRQLRLTRAALDAAIGEVEADESAGGTPHTQEGTSGPRKRLAVALKEHRFKGSVSACVFFAFLVFGFLVISMLAALPMYFPKFYGDPAAPSNDPFYFIAKTFCGGFTGAKDTFAPQSVWSPFYILFKGTGVPAGVTAAGSLIAAAALLSGLAGAVFALLSLVRKKGSEDFPKELVTVLIPLAGIVLGLVTAAFAKDGLAFMTLAYVCLFALGAKGACVEDGPYAKIVRILSIVCLFLLAVCFGLFAVFTFSIPTSGFMAGLWA